MPAIPLLTGSENSGLTHFVHDKGGAEISAYKMFTHDVFPFVDGFELVWRNVRSPLPNCSTCPPALTPRPIARGHRQQPLIGDFAA